jgi:hypothetical protein
VRSLAPWLGRLFADETLTRPHPKFWTYALASLAAGAVAPVSGDWLHPGALVPRAMPAPELLAVHRAAADVDGIGYLVTREPASGALWVLAWRHDHAPVTDEVADAGAPLHVDVRVPAGLRRLQSVETAAAAGGEPWRLTPWSETALVARAREVDGETFAIELRPESVQLLRVGG